MKIVDFESHAQIRECAHAKGDLMADFMPGIYDFDEERLGIMDRAGVTMQVLSYPGHIEALSPEDAMRVCQMENDNTYAAMQRHPGRFSGYAMVPVNNNEFALRELERAKNELGLVGWFVHSNYAGRAIDDDDLLPLVYKAAELGMHIYLHPGAPTWERFKGCGELVAGAYGFHVDPSLTLLRLITKGVFDKCPNLKIILGHYGEGLPFMLDRLDSMGMNSKESGKKMAEAGIVIPDEAVNEHSVGYYFENNIWVTTSGSYSKVSFECTRDRIGIDHMLFGSDFPAEELSKIMDFIGTMRMTKLEREKLFYKNAEEFFGISC